MDVLSAAAILISLAALFSWLNHRYIRQPQSIALLLFSLALSLALVALGKLGAGAERSLAVVMGGYALALALHLSGPIAIVVAGMLIGTVGRGHAMSARPRSRCPRGPSATRSSPSPTWWCCSRSWCRA